MPYRKLNGHEGEIQRCTQCNGNTMKFSTGLDGWVCTWCNNYIREEFLQATLPSSKQVEQDEIQPNQSNKQHERLYIKSIKAGYNNDSDYEESVNQGALSAAGSENKYRGSAQEALLQDTIKHHNELRRNAHIARQQRGQLLSGSQDQDSQEAELDRYVRRKLKERDDSL
jgi:hypothetical protein